jgi:hypothetical protein
MSASRRRDFGAATARGACCRSGRARVAGDVEAGAFRARGVLELRGFFDKEESEK